MRLRAVATLLAILANAQLAVADGQSGQAVFEKWCAACHIDSPLAPATVLLKARGLGGQSVISARETIDAGLVRTVVRKGLAGMPSFRRTEISVRELDALIEFLHQPKDSDPEGAGKQ